MNKKKAFLVLKIVVACILVGYFIATNDIVALGNYLKKIPLSVWVAAVALLLVQVFINTQKWHVLLLNYSFKNLMVANLITGFYALVLPGQLASEAVKAFIVGKKEKELEKVSASVIVDKITGLVALMLLGTIGVLFTEVQLGGYVVFIFILGSLLMVLALYLINFTFFKNALYRILHFLAKKNTKAKKITDVFTKLMDAWSEFSNNWYSIIWNIIYGLAFQFLACVMGVIFSNSIGVPVSLVDWLWIQAILSIVLLLPITIGGVGVREGTLIGILGLLGVSSEQAMVISFGFFGQQIVRALIGGVLEMQRNIMISKKDVS